jgi:hypothetical protein
MPTKERFTNNINNPLLKTISSGNGLMEFPLSTERNLHTYLHGNSAGTPVEIACNSSGHLLVDLTADSGSLHGLATEAKQDDIISNQTDGSSKVQVLGNEEGDGSGTARHIHTDGSGNVLTSVVSTVNISPANSVNSGTENSPANSVACGMKIRTNTAQASSELFVSGNSDGSVNIMNDPLNFDTATTILNQSIADGDQVSSSVVDLGETVDRDQLGNLEFFVNNSNSVPLTIKAIVSPDDGSNYYDNVNSKLVSSSGGAIQFNQDDIITRGIKYFILQVTNNHGGGTASTITIKHTNYK